MQMQAIKQNSDGNNAMHTTCRGKRKLARKTMQMQAISERKQMLVRKTVQMQMICKENKVGTQNDANVGDDERGHTKRCKCGRKRMRTHKMMQVQATCEGKAKAGVEKPNLQA